MAPLTPDSCPGVQVFGVERQGQTYQAATAPPGTHSEQSLPNAVYPTIAQSSTYHHHQQGSQEKLPSPSHTHPVYTVPAAYPAGSTGYPQYQAGQVVSGYPAAPVGANGQNAAVVTPGAVVYSETGNEPCDCSAGWVLFGVGWIFPICWLIGAFLPCCSKNRNDRRAAIGSGIMFAITVIVAVLCIVIPLTIMAGAASAASQSSSQYRSF